MRYAPRRHVPDRRSPHVAPREQGAMRSAKPAPRADAPERGARSFLRRARRQILAEWEKGARETPRAAALAQPQLINFIQSLLDRIADLTEQLLAGKVAELPPE